MEVWEEGDYVPVARNTAVTITENDSCIKMGSDKSCLNVSLIAGEASGQNHKTVSTDHNFSVKRKKSRSAFEPRSLSFSRCRTCHNCLY